MHLIVSITLTNFSNKLFVINRKEPSLKIICLISFCFDAQTEDFYAYPHFLDKPFGVHIKATP